jgi:hypothetical protein
MSCFAAGHQNLPLVHRFAKMTFRLAYLRKTTFLFYFLIKYFVCAAHRIQSTHGSSTVSSDVSALSCSASSSSALASRSLANKVVSSHF